MGKKHLLIILVAMAVLSIGVTVFASTEKPVKINKMKATVYVNNSIKLKITGTKKKVKWSSKNKKIALVSQSGEVTGKKVGKTTIIGTVAGQKYKCKVTVKKEKQSRKMQENKIKITISNEVFYVTLEDTTAAKELVEKLPMTITMDELNGNEKYYYMDDSLTQKASKVNKINTGDFMLYGSNCLVLFYDTFTTSYSYTPLGHMEDANGLAAALGKNAAKVTLELEK